VNRRTSFASGSCRAGLVAWLSMEFDADAELLKTRFRRRGAVDLSLRRVVGPPESWHLEVVFAGRRGLRLQADGPNLTEVEFTMLQTMNGRGIGELLFEDVVNLAKQRPPAR
jgi:hypothetical protein